MITIFNSWSGDRSAAASGVTPLPPLGENMKPLRKRFLLVWHHARSNCYNNNEEYLRN